MPQNLQRQYNIVWKRNKLYYMLASIPNEITIKYIITKEQRNTRVVR